MLVLSRKVGERIVIGPNVTITVVAVHGERVKLGFEAPGSVPIHRHEIYQRIQLEEEAAHAATSRAADASVSLVTALHPEFA
ncbi:MAG TPA: carbon storage regulator CsrA [Pirellulales bacterium]|nr:carbon storage regulator CsrA [Pirellulales bacterium]